MGKMIESMVMVIFGSLLGLGWSLFGLHMSDLVIDYNAPASSAVRALFLLSCVLFHGYVRSKSPRLFVFVWFFLIASVTTLLGRALEVTLPAFTNTEYPILTGAGVVLVINLSIFPEHSTSYLGSSTIDTMHEAVDTLTRATHWFVTPGGDSAEAKESEQITAQEKGKSKSKKKTWWEDFASDFPNPFQTTSSKKTKQEPVHLTTLASLAEKKTKLRSLALACKSAQNEVNFEFSVSPLEPKSLKPISKQGMSSLVQNTITLIGACENKFVLLKNSTTSAVDDENLEELEEDLVLKSGLEPDPTRRLAGDSQAPVAPNILKRVPEEDAPGDDENDFKRRVEDVKPLREIGTASEELLESLLRRIRDPTHEFEAALREATTLLLTCLAYCFDVPKLPSGVLRPRGINLQEIDIRIDSFADALQRFDARSAEELRNAALDETDSEVDLMPRMEMFLVSSFILGFRQAATHVLTMLHHARTLVERRQQRNDRPKIWMPHYTDVWQWLSTSGEADSIVLPESARREARTSRTKKPDTTADSAESSSSEEPLPWQKKDEETAVPKDDAKAEKRHVTQNGHSKQKPSTVSRKSKDWSLRIRGQAADVLEWAQHSDDLTYALKMALAVFVVSWPSFVPSWRAWYGEVRGIWAPLQLVLVFEVSIGTSFFIFFIRLIGVIFGCLMGLLSYEIGSGNRIVMVVVLIFGIAPSVYIQVATKYVKAGMIAGTTMCVVALAAMNQSGTAVENFYKRLVAFLVGSLVAILVELLILPVRARDRLVESLSSAVRRVQDMQSALSVGIDSPEKPNFRSHKVHHRFSHARDKAQGALAAAETFLPFCLNEPRLKGSFKTLEPIYKEIIYVLHQIIDRMDNIVDLRKAYGSSILEDLNAQVFAYRRNVAAGNMLVLFAVHEALTTWLPLPQFLPSSRLAQARFVNRVREIIASKAPAHLRDLSGEKGSDISKHLAGMITERKFLSWNAVTAGYMELIEYLEELVELTKLLVGVNAFRSGLLERPQYKDYVQQARKAELNRISSRRSHQEEVGGAARLRRAVAVAASVQKFRLAAQSHMQEVPTSERVPENAIQDDEEEDDRIPMSLRRVGTRLHRESTVSKRRRFTSDSRA